MKKIITALKLFDKKIPNVEVKAIECTLPNWFTVTTANGDRYTVTIADNAVEPFYSDIDW